MSKLKYFTQALYTLCQITYHLILSSSQNLMEDPIFEITDKFFSLSSFCEKAKILYLKAIILRNDIMSQFSSFHL